MTNLEILKARRDKLDKMIIQIENIEITIAYDKQILENELNREQPDYKEVALRANEINYNQRLITTMISKEFNKKEAMLFISDNSE